MQVATSDVVAGASSMEAGVGRLRRRACARRMLMESVDESGLGLARVGWWASRPGTRGRAGALAGFIRMRGWGQLNLGVRHVLKRVTSD